MEAVLLGGRLRERSPYRRFRAACVDCWCERGDCLRRYVLTAEQAAVALCTFRCQFGKLVQHRMAIEWLKQIIGSTFLNGQGDVGWVIFRCAVDHIRFGAARDHFKRDQEVMARHRWCVPIEQDVIRHRFLAVIETVLAGLSFNNVEVQLLKNVARHSADDFRVVDDQAIRHREISVYPGALAGLHCAY